MNISADWREWRVPLGLVAAAVVALWAAWGAAPSYFVPVAEAKEDRRDTAEWRYEQTLVRLREAKASRAVLQARTDLPADVKAELLSDLDAEIDLYKRRLDCYEKVMETGKRIKCP